MIMALILLPWSKICFSPRGLELLVLIKKVMTEITSVSDEELLEDEENKTVN